MWTAISPSGFLAYSFYDDAINEKEYIRILKTKLLPVAKSAFKGKKEWTFQQDNAFPHSTDRVHDFLEEKEVHVMHWSPRSPDLSPIENCWVKMEQEIRRFRPETKEELQSAVEAVIKKMNEDEPGHHSLFQKSL